MLHGAYALTVDTSGLTDGIQSLLDNVFPWVGTALLILAPIAAIGIGFRFGRQLLSFVTGALGGLGGGK